MKIMRDMMIVCLMDTDRIAVNFVHSDGKMEYCIIADDNRHQLQTLEIMNEIRMLNKCEHGPEILWNRLLEWCLLPGYGDRKWKQYGTKQATDTADHVSEILNIRHEYTWDKWGHERVSAYEVTYIR